jgi:hypothetical protein
LSSCFCSGFVHQKAVEKIVRGLVRPEPAFVQQRTVYFILKNQQLVIVTVGSQPLGQVNGLPGHDVAIIVAMNELKQGRKIQQPKEQTPNREPGEAQCGSK